MISTIEVKPIFAKQVIIEDETWVNEISDRYRAKEWYATNNSGLFNIVFV